MIVKLLYLKGGLNKQQDGRLINWLVALGLSVPVVNVSTGYGHWLIQENAAWWGVNLITLVSSMWTQCEHFKIQKCVVRGALLLIESVVHLVNWWLASLEMMVPCVLSCFLAWWSLPEGAQRWVAAFGGCSLSALFLSLSGDPCLMPPRVHRDEMGGSFWWEFPIYSSSLPDHQATQKLERGMAAAFLGSFLHLSSFHHSAHPRVYTLNSDHTHMAKLTISLATSSGTALYFVKTK